MSETGAAIASPADAEAQAAVRAWRVLEPQARPPDRVEKVKQGERSAIYRLFAARTDGRSVIGKRSLKANGLFERGVYQHIIAKLPTPFLEDYGVIAESDSEFCWHFMGDAGDIKFRADASPHRQALARRLGLLHTQAFGLSVLRDLPDRGPKLHLDYLRSGRQEIVRFLEACPMNADTARTFGRILGCYERLEPRWPDIETICAAFPKTFVHGDVSARNIRLRVTEGSSDPILFDWEWAGHGSPAIDLWMLGRDDAAIYLDSVKISWPNIKLEDIYTLIRIGMIFRSIMVLEWKSKELSVHTIERPLRIMVSNYDRLMRAMSVFGWTG